MIPRYEPIFVEPSLKEYETQVLQMSVPPGDDADDTLSRPEKLAYGAPADYGQPNGRANHSRQMKPKRSSSDFHPFHLDNISYITKDKTGKLYTKGMI